MTATYRLAGDASADIAPFDGASDSDMPLDDEMLAAIAAAEAAVADMAEDYPALLLQDTATLKGAVESLQAYPPGTDGHMTACASAFGTLHDIKGQAASFGFDAATALSGPLCEMMRETVRADARMAGLLEAACAVFERLAAAGPGADLDGEATALIATVRAGFLTPSET